MTNADLLTAALGGFLGVMAFFFCVMCMAGLMAASEALTARHVRRKKARWPCVCSHRRDTHGPGPSPEHPAWTTRCMRWPDPNCPCACLEYRPLLPAPPEVLHDWPSLGGRAMTEWRVVWTHSAPGWQGKSELRTGPLAVPTLSEADAKSLAESLRKDDVDGCSTQDVRVQRREVGGWADT